MRWLKIIGTIIGGLILIGLGFGYLLFRPTLSVDINQPPQVVQADFIDLSKIYSISKYRSASGHDFSGNGETCRSMKHYFQPQETGKGSDITQFMQAPAPGTGIAIYSPVDGRIVGISEERTPIGKQFTIRTKAKPNVSFRLFHVYPVEGIKIGKAVTAGELIGYINDGQGTDIAVQATSLTGTKLFSYFEVMPDSVFAAYQARGVGSRDDLIISKAERDAQPLQCTGEQFAQNYDGDPSMDNYVRLSGYQAQIYSENQPQTNQ